jgi:predicted dehydrogenase
MKLLNHITGTVNWGIIGCGDVCEVKSGPAFNKVPNSKLVAVMRRDLAKVKDYATRHQVPKFYTDATELIEDREVNAIYIATPPSLHETYTLLALQAGKPVYVEKPVTVNSPSCERMIKSAESSHSRVSIAHYRRRLPLFMRVKELIRSNTIGQPLQIQIRVLQPAKSKIITHTPDNWRIKPEHSGGGLFHDLSPHQLDILYWIFGEPLKVSGHSQNQLKQYDAPDLTVLEAVFINEVYLNGLWAFNVPENSADDFCEIIGENGSIRFSFFKAAPIILKTASGTESIDCQFPTHLQQPMIEDVTKYFRNEGSNPCSLQEALIVMKMMDSTNTNF